MLQGERWKSDGKVSNSPRMCGTNWDLELRDVVVARRDGMEMQRVS